MKKVTELQLEQYLLGELSKDVEGDLDAPDVQFRVLELRQSNDEILLRYPAQEMARRIEERAAKAPARTPLSGEAKRQLRIVRPGRKTGFIVLVPLTAAAATLIAYLGLSRPVLGGSSKAELSGIVAEDTRVKGLEPRLRVYRKLGSQVEALGVRSKVRRNDLLQLAYVAAGHQYGLILSLDGRGSLTVHFPERGSTAARLEAAGEVTLPFSYELDDAPNFEVFYFITAEKPFPLTLVEQAVKASGTPPSERLALPEGFFQTSVPLVKE